MKTFHCTGPREDYIGVKCPLSGATVCLEISSETFWSIRKYPMKLFSISYNRLFMETNLHKEISSIWKYPQYGNIVIWEYPPYRITSIIWDYPPYGNIFYMGMIFIWKYLLYGNILHKEISSIWKYLLYGNILSTQMILQESKPNENNSCYFIKEKEPISMQCAIRPS